MRGAPEELRENSSTCAEKGLLSQFGAWICPMLPFELSPLDSGIWASSVLAFELCHLPRAGGGSSGAVPRHMAYIRKEKAAIMAKCELFWRLGGFTY